MKKQIKILILLILLCFSRSAFCYTLNSNQISSYLKNEVLKETKEILKNDKDIKEIKVEISNLPFNEIKTNENISPKIELTSSSNIFQAISYRRVLIKDSKNNIVKAFPISIQTRVYKDVLIATMPISFNSELTNLNTKLERKEVSKNLNNTIQTYKNGFITKKNYQKNDCILSSDLKSKSLILKNSTVDIIFLSSKGLTIKLQGKALNDGALGETILVRSTKYNKTYSATISSGNEVLVRI